MEPVLELLQLLWPLLQHTDKELAQTLTSLGMPPYFALSWYITWFAHDVSDLKVSRLRERMARDVSVAVAMGCITGIAPILPGKSCPTHTAARLFDLFLPSHCLMPLRVCAVAMRCLTIMFSKISLSFLTPLQTTTRLFDLLLPSHLSCPCTSAL